MNLFREAVHITRELGDVVFVGALAIIARIGAHRATRDIDLAMTNPLSEAEFEKRGYLAWPESGKLVRRTPRGVKVAIYTKDVSGIPVAQIFETAVTQRVGKKEIKVMCLEALLVAKLRAGRPQDIDDVQELCRRKGRSIQWAIVKSIATPTEIDRLRVTVSAVTP